MTAPVLGIIGGSGVYDLPGLEAPEWRVVESPWGEPSDAILHAQFGGLELRFLPRHERGHRLSPSGINYRANIDALKRAGVTDLYSVSAVGSLREDMAPGDFVFVDQYIDRTFARETSYFGNGCVAHVGFGHPVSPHLATHAQKAAVTCGIPHHMGGTLVVMEGPQFSTRAESEGYRAMGAHLIGMTALPEAKLAREAELPYATIAMVTDYDCWHPDHDHVDVATVIATLKANTANAQALIAEIARSFPRGVVPDAARVALDGAIMTAPAKRDPVLVAKLGAVAGRVLG
ncbi:S-methyl-5'-thioadenosine phosphorylase [Pelagibacterium halotolerans]|uniref:S-methyl-5'-thioadenosine phosphorylase n=1 Tax=Pelagibacterium halotolerans TaxID=531813 RepID=UPI00384C2071